MHDLDDNALLREFAERGSEPAFAELVTRHVDKVYSAALRHTRNSHSAEEITQAVFVLLAQKASQLHRHAVLSGWLYQTARLTALTLIRGDIRRARREQEVFMQTSSADSAADPWPHIAPLLDDALARLSETDRHAVVLRYFDGKSLREVGTALGGSEDAAKMRVNRAVEKLRTFFAKRGVTLSATALTTALAANSVQSAPVGLAAAVTTAALSGTALTTSALIAATKTIAMTTLQKTLVTVTVAVLAGTGIYEARQAAQLREQNQTLQQAQAPLVEQLTKLRAENDRLSNLVAQAKDSQTMSKAQFNELLKLRGQTGQAQTAVQQLAKLKASVAQQNGTMPAFLTNAMAQGMAMAEKFKKKDALAQVARMKDKLHLTDDQAQAISDLMVKHIEERSQLTLKAMPGWQMSGTLKGDTAYAPDNEEAEITALLNPDQLAAYPGYKQAEAITAAQNSANGEVSTMTGEMELTQAQQDQIQSALYQYNLNQASAGENTKAAMAQLRAGGNIADFMGLQLNAQKRTLEDKLKILGPILTPDQLNTYQQKQLDMMDMQASAMKMFLPPATNAPAQ